jgi:hypothetical protein
MKRFVPGADADRRELNLLIGRVTELANSVLAGRLQFTDAVDLAYFAAESLGLTYTIGDDAVQIILAAAFAAVPRATP